ncbi:MAG: hypothetical protein M3460_28295 [Actinomycetota bacterium]|nr:hypothetical protein [Actinomycetota bacterium]
MVYFGLHGVVKLALVGALLRRWLPIAVVVLGAPTVAARDDQQPHTASAAPTAAPGLSGTTRWAFCTAAPVSCGAFAIA